MKQHISLEQFNELSNKGKEKLHGWWFEHVQKTIRQDIPTLLSIGQMIEFIGTPKMYTLLNDGKLWFVEVKGKENSIYATELCDALWEVVKEILNNS